jgi:hypothetical protein
MRNLKPNKKNLNEAWTSMIKSTTGIQDENKLQVLAEMAHAHSVALQGNAAANAQLAQHFAGFGALNEATMPGSTATSGGAYYASAPGTVGGVYAPYQTLYNTLGIGNAVPAGKAALTGADYADGTQMGSGDKWSPIVPLALKVAAKTIGYDLVNHTQLNGPTGVLPFLDYVYSGTKQPYGATPAYDPNTANVDHFGNSDTPYALYGLPHAFKASIADVGSAGSVVALKAALRENKLVPGSAATITSAGGSVDVEFIGWSRIDGNPMFKVVKGTADLGSIFNGAAQDITLAGQSFKVAQPSNVSLLEDQIQGFTGSGVNDRDPWYGTYQDGTVLYEPMSRGTGEMSYARQLSLQVFTKNITVGTIMVSVAVTQEQVTDLQKQWGIDVLKMIENAGVNELSSTINRHILSRLFALGWKNHVKLAEVEGNCANLNITFAENSATAGVYKNGMTPAFAIPQGDATQVGPDGTYRKWTNVSMPYRPLYLNSKAIFENQATLLQRLQMNFLTASNWILQRGRYGAATFAVTNITVATALQSNAQNMWAPIANNVSQNGNSLYPVGTLAGITIYVDPLMAGNDTRVLVGRKGGKDEPGTHFCPYLIAESVKMIAEGTAAPKIVIKSRYALVDIGFYPETQYLTFHVDFAGMF